MMPGVGLDRGALHVFAKANHDVIENFLHGHHHDQHDERERRRPVMRDKDFANALNRETDGCQEDPHGHNRRRQRLGFSMSVGMRFVRRSRGKLETAPDHDRSRDIKRGFYSIGDQDVRITEEARGNFRGGKDHVHQHPDERDPRAALHIAGRIVRDRLNSLRHYGENF